MTAPYTAATVVTATGGELAPGGTQATFAVTIALGSITVIAPVDGGGPYNIPPTLTITDTGGGAGQTAAALLGIGNVVPGNNGSKYTTPLVAVVPFFKTNFPDSAGLVTQASSIQGWMVQNFQNALLMGVTCTPTAT